MKKTAFLLLFLFVLAACAQGSAELKPPEIRYGETTCTDCNMIISDERFAAAYAYEVGAGRYQSAVFDDIGDMLRYADEHPEHTIAARYVHDYESKAWIDAATASYVVSDTLETPMASGIAAFSTADRAEALAYSLGSTVLTWDELKAMPRGGMMP